MADDSPVVTVETSLGWNPNDDEHRRAFIIENYANADLDPAQHVKGLELVFQWLKNGTPDKPPLRPVK